MRPKLISILLLSFSLTVISQTQLEFSFFDTSGKVEYKSNQLDKDLMKYYGIEKSNPKMILLLTKSLIDTDYIRQSKILDQIDMENLRTLVVVSCTTEEYMDGYHTDIETANYLAEKLDGFTLLILDAQGGIMSQYKNVVTQHKITKILCNK